MATPQLNPAPQFFDSNQPFSFLRRNAGLIVLVGLIVSGWMLVYTFTMFHPKFGAKATVIIKDSAITNRYVEPEQFYAMQTTTSTSSNPVLNTMGILKSEAISDALWAYFVEKHPEELKRLKIKTQKDWESFYQDGSSFIKAKNQPGTDLISIQFSWTEPQIAKDSLNVVVKAFQDASRDLNKEEQISRTKFLSRQMGDIEGKLQAIRNKKSEYESQNATVSVKRESDDLAGSRMELSNKLAQLQGQAQGKENLVRRYQGMLGMSSEAALRGAALGQNSTMVKLQDELYRLQQLHSLMSSSLTDTNPKVREVQAQIDQVQANIEQEKGRVMGPFGKEAGSVSNDGEVIADSTRNTLIGDMLKAQGEAQDLRAQAARIEQRLGQVNADIRSFPTTAVGLANLEQQETTLSTALDHLRQKVMEGKMKEAQTLSNVFIVDSPRLPEHPSFPNRTHLIVISILMGVAAGVSVAFIKDQVFGKPAFNPAFIAYPGQFAEEQWSEEAPHFYATQEEAFADQHADPIEEQYPETQWQPVAATNFSLPEIVHEVEPIAQSAAPQIVRNAPNADDVLGINPPIEKVEVPVTGSLFDSLLPIAGPMARNLSGNHQPHIQSEELRRDLSQGHLPEAEVAQTDHDMDATFDHLSIFDDQDLLPPGVSFAPELQTVHAASEKLAQAFTPAQGVPVMHVAPSATPSYVEDPLSVDISAAQNTEFNSEGEEEIDEFPNLVLNENDFSTPVNDNLAVGETDPATTLYEAQAKAMPLPRKRRVRSVPAFLLDDKTIDVQAENNDDRHAPYELVSRKRLAEQEANEPQTVVSNDFVAQTASFETNHSDEELSHQFSEFSPMPTRASANLANSNFPPMPEFVPPEFAKRRNKGLFGGLFSSGNKYGQKELVLGGHLHPRNR